MHRPPVYRGASVSRFPLDALRCFQRLRSLRVRQPSSPCGRSRWWGLHPLSQRNRHPDHFLSGPVSASPNPLDRTRRLAWQIGSKTALQPPAPFVAAPAPLRARGFSNSPRGWRPRDVGWSMEQGWRPCCSSPREREWCWQHRQPWHGHRPGHPLRECSSLTKDALDARPDRPCRNLSLSCCRRRARFALERPDFSDRASLLRSRHPR